jgi:hypothetical protein
MRIEFLNVGHISSLLFAIIMVVASATVVHSQQLSYTTPPKLPNPYQLDANWPTLPSSMNGGRWGEVIRVHVAPDGNIWVFHRCFNTVPPGHATCINRGAANPPILEFSPSGKLLRSFGTGLFAYPHGFTVDNDGNLWTTDVNDEPIVNGMSAQNGDGVLMGHEAIKLSPEGKVLMTLGKEGTPGNGPDTFDRPTGVAVAPNGDIFVSDGHVPNTLNNARIMKFSRDGKFIKSWGHKGSAPGDFNEPHDIYVGGSRGWVYVADRRNRRIQVFDQNGKFIADWYQFGEPSSVFVGADDTIYVGASFNEPNAEQGAQRGIVVGNAIDGSLKSFLPDPTDLDASTIGTTASGIAADDSGNVYAADVGAHKLRKYRKVR